MLIMRINTNVSLNHVAISVVLSFFGCTTAHADCIATGNSYICSDTTIQDQVLIGDIASVFIDGNYSPGSGNNSVMIENQSINPLFVSSAGTINSNNIGLNIINPIASGGIFVNQTQGSVLGMTGIRIKNYGAGETIVTTDGSVTGTGNSYLDNGIYLSSNNSGENASLTVNQTGGNISGGGAGIATTNNSLGKTTITTAGNISSANGYGIVAEQNNSSNIAELVINQISGSISGLNTGIRVINYSSGDATINTNGDIFGTSGIYLSASNGNAYINQNGGSITGGGTGIAVDNNSKKETVINTAGIVKADSGVAILASNGDGGMLTINQTAGYITGDIGIYVINNGSGISSVNVSGTIAGGNDSGIRISGQGGNSVNINLNSGANVSSISGNAIIDGSSNTTLIMGDNSKLTGKILLGDGSDNIIIKGTADISGVTLINGGNNPGEWWEGNDILGTPGAATNKLSFSGTAQNIAASIINNWQTVILDKSNVTFLGDSELMTGTGVNPDNSLQGLVLTNSSVINNPSTLSIHGDVYIDATSEFTHTMGGSITGNITNAGLINWMKLGQTLIVDGDYIGITGSVLRFNSVLADDNSVTDKMVVNGDTSGMTSIYVNNMGGTGAKTLNGIELIHVNGLSEGNFIQSGRIVAGAYDYTLNRGVGTNSSNWYLTSTLNSVDPVDPTVIRPEAGGYINNLYMANQLFNTRLHDRLGETQYTDVLTGEKRVTSMWLRNVAGHTNNKSGGNQLKTGSNRYVMQLGGDVAQWSDNGLDRYHIGLMAGYGRVSGKTSNNLTGYQAKSHIDGYSIGIYGTYYANQEDKTGLYVDTWAQYNWFHNRVNGDNLAEEKYNAKGISASAETGYTFLMNETYSSNGNINRWFIQPKAQVTYSGVNMDNHTESNGTQVSGNGENGIQTRLGVRLFGLGHALQDNPSDREFQPFVEANWINNSTKIGVSMDGTQINQSGTRNIGEIKAGLEGRLTKNTDIWFNVAQQVGTDNYTDTQGMLGVKVHF